MDLTELSIITSESQGEPILLSESLIFPASLAVILIHPFF